MNNRFCLQCGTLHVPEHQPCPSCGLLRGGLSQAQGSTSFSSRALSGTLDATGTRAQTLPILLLPKGTTLEHERYLLLEPRRIQQWGSSFTETLWQAHEREPETQQERAVLIADVAFPTYRQHQEVGRAARQAFLSSEEPHLLNTFLERDHAFFVFAEAQGESLQQRIDRQAFLREEEAMRALYELTRTVMRLSSLQPPVTHGWISPAHLVQRGTAFQVLPASVLVAGVAARFLDGSLAPAGVRAGFHPGNDVLAAVKTVYAGLTGVFPAPNYGLPAIQPQVSASFATLLARGLQSALTPAELLQALSLMLGEPASASPRHADRRFSGPYAPASRVAEIPMASSDAREAQGPLPARFPQVTPASAEVAPDVPPGLPHPDPPDTALALPTYPQAADGLHAVYWSCAILAAEALFLLFSR